MEECYERGVEECYVARGEEGVERMDINRMGVVMSRGHQIRRMEIAVELKWVLWLIHTLLATDNLGWRGNDVDTLSGSCTSR